MLCRMKKSKSVGSRTHSWRHTPAISPSNRPAARCRSKNHAICSRQASMTTKKDRASPSLFPSSRLCSLTSECNTTSSSQDLLFTVELRTRCRWWSYNSNISCSSTWVSSFREAASKCLSIWPPTKCNSLPSHHNSSSIKAYRQTSRVYTCVSLTR